MHSRRRPSALSGSRPNLDGEEELAEVVLLVLEAANVAADVLLQTQLPTDSQAVL